MTHASFQRARRLLGALHDRIHAAVIAARARQAARLSRVVGVTEADTIYLVDRIAETVILAWFEREWPRAWPVELVMEGLDENGEAVTFPRGTPVSRTLLKCIVDPVDGTRGFMHDKRSAWVLTGLARQRGNEDDARRYRRGRDDRIAGGEADGIRPAFSGSGEGSCYGPAHGDQSPGKTDWNEPVAGAEF